MTEELENKNEGISTGNNRNREGYEQNENSTYRSNSDRPMRPRIRIQNAYTQNRVYGSKSNVEGGFRPEGFGNAYKPEGDQPRPYRPRYNNGGQPGAYQPRPNQYGQRTYNSYRPRYNNENSEGGYQPRPNQYGQRPNAGYRPRYNSPDPEGGYQPRQTPYGQRPNTSYRPRYSNDPEGGYQPRQTPYGQRPNTGYRPRYNSNGENGYQPRQGGYHRNTGYRPRADYDPSARYSMKKRIEYKETNIDPTVPVRLNKFLANAGVCSRREADEYIKAGVVSVNGNVVTELGTKVLRTDEVKFHDQKVNMEKKVYVLLNKPKDCVTTIDDPNQRKTVMDLVKGACPERIYPVGRLDRNTTGVLLLTNDGELASKLTHPQFLKKKIYHVFLDKNVTAHDMQQIADGITLEDGEIHADAIEYASDTDKSQVGIEIHSGKNRIVRRIFESLGYRVIKLDRVLFAGLTKKNVRRGDWRFLTEKEVEMLRMGAFQ
ncbi:MAG: pseudouridine synthase [Prevotella sp.]|nr:pseudouridine synthase [Prevotella sp.]